MGIETPFHPEQTPGSINNFSFHRLERNTKTILVNILKTFFSMNTQLYKMAVPQIVETQNKTTDPKIFIERDFPFTERKLPLIAVSIKSMKEKKAYVGADNMLYPDIRRTSTGDYLTGYNVYAGMQDVDVTLIIAALSQEQRMELKELINLCFTHYYRWQYFYYDEQQNMFNIVPTTTPVEFSGENEVTDPSNVSLIYTTTSKLSSRIEYSFKDYAMRYEQMGATSEIDSEAGATSP